MFCGDTYTAEVGPGTYLQLRFEPIPEPVLHINPGFDHAELSAENANIALLMTDEHPNTTIQRLGELMFEQLRTANIHFSTVVSPVSLGTVLGREIARCAEENETERVAPPFSLQKGKFLEISTEDEAATGGGYVWIPADLLDASSEKIRRYLENGQRMGVGPPKPWVRPEDCRATASGTSKVGSTQLLSLDPKVADYMRWTAMETGHGTILVDDAYLLGGTARSSLELLLNAGILVEAVFTVLNEGPNNPLILNSAGHEIPRMWLTKLPLFAQIRDQRGQPARMPIPGTYEGLRWFYRRVN